MRNSANIQSYEAIRDFAASVIRFQEEARQCLTAIETQLQKMLFWLEQDRPNFWKRRIEDCSREMSEARVRLHQCRMRRIGDFRPSCIEELKALEHAKRELKYSQDQIPVVKQWTVAAHHEANEYHGRSSRMTNVIDREVPRLLALLTQSLKRLEAYSESTAAPDNSLSSSDEKDNPQDSKEPDSDPTPTNPD